MTCLHCNNEMAEELTTCPACGKPASAQESTSDTPEKIESLLKTPVKDYLARPFIGEGAFKKILIWGLISAIPVVNWILPLGYCIEYMRRIMFREQNMELPDWSDGIKAGVREGLLFNVATLIYSIFLTIFSGALLYPFREDLMMLSKIDFRHFNFQQFDPLSPEFDILVKVMIPLHTVIIIFGLFMLILPLFTVLYARNRRFRDYFNFREVFSLFIRNFINYHVVLGLVTAIGLIVFPLCFILLFIPIVGYVASSVLSFAVTISFCSALGEFYYRRKRN